MTLTAAIEPHPERTRVLSRFKLESGERRGDMLVRSLRLRDYPDDLTFELRSSWARNQRAWRAGGWGWSRDAQGEWRFVQYLNLDGGLTPKGIEILENYDAEQTELFAWKDEQATWDPEVELPPAIASKLFDYQVRPARLLLRSVLDYGSAVDCSDLGTGKTYQTMAAAIASEREVGIIRTVNGETAWRRAAEHFGLRPIFSLNYEALKTGRQRFLRRFGKEYEWQLRSDEVILIWDEAHRCCNPQALNTKMLAAAIEAGIPCLGASATLASDPVQMSVTGRLAGLHRGGPTFVEFLLANKCFRDGTSWNFRGGRKVMARIHRKIFPRHGARVCIEDLGDKFPETQIICEAFETGHATEIQEAYYRAKQAVEKMRGMGVKEEILRENTRFEYMEARKESERLKVPALMEMIREHTEAGRHVAVFVNFTETREFVMRLLKTTCGIYGGMNPFVRRNTIAAFQADREPVIVCQIQAGGESVDLHDINGNFPRTAIIMPGPDARLVRQALGRVRRAGGLSKSIQIIFYASGTVEADICKSVREKLQNIDTLNDGDCEAPPEF